jgi:hypothetical protein
LNIGGKGTANRKKLVHRTATADDLKQMNKINQSNKKNPSVFFKEVRGKDYLCY